MCSSTSPRTSPTAVKPDPTYPVRQLPNRIAGGTRVSASATTHRLIAWQRPQLLAAIGAEGSFHGVIGALANTRSVIAAATCGTWSISGRYSKSTGSSRSSEEVLSLSFSGGQRHCECDQRQCTCVVEEGPFRCSGASSDRLLRRANERIWCPGHTNTMMPYVRLSSSSWRAVMFDYLVLA